MKKVLLISGSWPPMQCGIGIYSQRFYEHISDNKDIEITLLTSETFKPSQPKSYSTPQWRFRDLPAMLRSVKLTRPDIVHLQYPTLPYRHQIGINLLPYFLRLHQQYVVITVHEYFQTSLLGKIRTCITVLPAHKIIVSNEADLKTLPKFLRKKIKIIPIGANVPLKKPDQKRLRAVLGTSGLSLDKQTVIFFGLPFPNKRLDVLIDAAYKFSEKLQLLLVFNDKSRSAYVKEILRKVSKAKASGVSIGLTGYLDDQDLSAALHYARYFVLPQTNPPLTAKSGTAIAAALHGCIVLAAKPAPEQLSTPFVSDENCVLLDEMAPDSLANKLNELSVEPKKQVRISKNAGKLGDYFSWSTIIDKYITIYNKID